VKKLKYQAYINSYYVFLSEINVKISSKISLKISSKMKAFFDFSGTFLLCIESSLIGRMRKVPLKVKIKTESQMSSGKTFHMVSSLLFTSMT
jgi:hypothetical protein